MKNCLLLLLLFLSGQSIILAQYDVSVHYGKQNFTDWNNVIRTSYPDQSSVVSNAFGIGAAYRYFPHRIRIGYAPELGISFAVDKMPIHKGLYTNEYLLMQTYLSLPVQVFPLDLEGDCNCPTFGRQNDFFKKALFLKFIPKISFQYFKLGNSSGSSVSYNFSYSFGFGAGINIAINQKLSIAPEASYHFIFNENWDGFSDFHNWGINMDKTSATKLIAGLRFSLYLD